MSNCIVKDKKNDLTLRYVLFLGRVLISIALGGMFLFLLLFIIIPIICFFYKIFVPEPKWIPELEYICSVKKINLISSDWDKVFLNNNPNFGYYIKFNSEEDRLDFLQLLIKNSTEHELNIKGSTLHTSPENLDEYKYFDDSGGKYYLDHGYVVIPHYSILNIRYRFRILCSPNGRYMHIYGVKEFN